MRGLWQEFADLVLPGGCAGCGVPRAPGQLCADCRGMLRRAVPHRVRPTPAPPGLPEVYAAVAYADEPRAVLLAHKERGALRLAAPLGAVLAGCVRAVAAAARPGGHGPSAGGPAAARPLVLVPVPSARRAVAGRGHDPVRRLALAASGALRRSGVPARVLGALRQRRAVADQAGLTAGQRRANLSGALEPAAGSGRLLERAEVVLVDDLMTTGASLVEAARAVASANGRMPVAAVVAARCTG